MSAASWGPSCSVVPRSRCDTRRRMEESGQAYWSMWDGLLFPVTADSMKPKPYSWGNTCPFCGGDVRLGIRQQIANEAKPDWLHQADGEGEE
jgi:hypothetical protein